MGPRAVAGLAASRDSIAPSKWTSPPKARVTGSPVGSLVAPARWAVVAGRWVVVVALAAPVVWVAGAACPGSSPASPQALSNASAATVSEATRWRRRGRDGRWGGRGTAGSRVGARGSAA